MTKGIPIYSIQIFLGISFLSSLMSEEAILVKIVLMMFFIITSFNNFKEELK